jgi:hypothetical protein
MAHPYNVHPQAQDVGCEAACRTFLATSCLPVEVNGPVIGGSMPTFTLP